MTSIAAHYLSAHYTLTRGTVKKNLPQFESRGKSVIIHDSGQKKLTSLRTLDKPEVVVVGELRLLIPLK